MTPAEAERIGLRLFELLRSDIRDGMLIVGADGVPVRVYATDPHFPKDHVYVAVVKAMAAALPE